MRATVEVCCLLQRHIPQNTENKLTHKTQPRHRIIFTQAHLTHLLGFSFNSEQKGRTKAQGAAIERP